MRSLMGNCYFCESSKYKSSLISEDKLCIVLRDNYPITKLHTLIVPKKHIDNLFELDLKLYNYLFKQARIESKKLLELDNSIEGFNLGVNQGIVAGQTVMHVHIHLIPRRKGDKEDPRGGVRWIMPEKAKYW